MCTFRYFVHNLDVEMTQFSLSEKSHQNVPFVFNSADVFPLCWLVSRCSCATPSRLPLRRAPVCEGACRRLGRSLMLPFLKENLLLVYMAQLYICICLYMWRRHRLLSPLFMEGVYERNGVHGASGWQVSAWMWASRRRRQEKWPVGELWGCACFARDCACCWFC